ncbi:MAG: amidohydrolase family protein [Pseudomonadota bacterium]|nr:amidohydrolase family protein [Pseudomonadota bacterium]
MAEHLKAIDIVCNAFTPEAIQNGWMSTDSEFHKKVRVKEEYRNGVSAESYIEIMDRCGIERSFLIASRSGDIRIQGSAHMPTDYIASLVNAHPDRFSGLIGIDPSSIMESLAEVEHAIQDFGFIGAHLYPHWFDEPPDASKYYPFYAKCCDLGVPVQMQVGHCLVYNPHRRLPSVGRPICLDQIAMDFPDLKLVGIHIGYPWYEEMISVAWKHPNVFIGLDAYAPKHWPLEIKNYMNTFGQDKVLFGTDWPVVDPERAMNDVEEIEWKPSSKDKVLRTNALNLYDL